MPSSNRRNGFLYHFLLGLALCFIYGSSYAYPNLPTDFQANDLSLDPSLQQTNVNTLIPTRLETRAGRKKLCSLLKNFKPKRPTPTTPDKETPSISTTPYIYEPDSGSDTEPEPEPELDPDSDAESEIASKPQGITIAGVDFFKENMQKGLMRKHLPYVFYTNFPNTEGTSERAKQWAKDFFQEVIPDPQRTPSLYENHVFRQWKYFKFLMWGRVTRADWGFGIMIKWIEWNIEDVMGDHDMAQWYVNVAEKNQAQALSEICRGDVILVVPDEINPNNDVNGWSTIQAWGGK
ncbi:hypothetical protein NUU61_005718 [Penicillium alfredii]|uniref:Uncharacterized protein n=1 Tax=Penicillium alfredii TaxID=1506179 RepID=A0A9W9K8X0_9EURO|nr:uncharacterized protein NUU61_005718 [Penicillium alfredii]KAJ5096362.1 hypothetical protein NUU61_005718 [Penicillium alfredii]